MPDLFNKSSPVRYLHGALLASSVLLASGLSEKVEAQEAPTGPELAELVNAVQDRNVESFTAYLDELSADGTVDGLDIARNALQSENGPDEQQLERPLGVYNRVANQIPEQATATLDTDDTQGGGDSQALNDAADACIADNGGDFTMAATAGDDQVKLTVSGTSAPEPENGVNPVPRLAGFLMSTDVGLTTAESLKRCPCCCETYSSRG